MVGLKVAAMTIPTSIAKPHVIKILRLTARRLYHAGPAAENLVQSKPSL
jgi:hypothetical protein